jgi:hypothetical protein
MGVPTSEVGYTSATTGRVDQEVHKGHVVALAQKRIRRQIQTPKPIDYFLQFHIYKNLHLRLKGTAQKQNIVSKVYSLLGSDAYGRPIGRLLTKETSYRRSLYSLSAAV